MQTCLRCGFSEADSRDTARNCARPSPRDCSRGLRTRSSLVLSPAAATAARIFAALLLLENRLDSEGGAENQHLGGGIVLILRGDLHTVRIVARQERLGEPAPRPGHGAHLGAPVGR